MKKIAPLLLGLGLCLWAADVWQTKPYTDWSDKDIQKLETNSPWSKQVPVALEGGGGGGSSKGGRKSSNASEIDGGGNGSTPMAGVNPGRNAGLQDVGGGGVGGGAAMTVTVSWRTALPIREAVAKEKFGAEAATSADAKKLIEEEQKFYAIMLTGLPGRVLHGGDKLKESLLKATSLNVKGKDPVAPSDIQVGGNEQRALVMFMFPKTTPLSVDDKEVEFSTKIGPITVKQKFHLKEMLFNGKLDL
jgi:hypothetical protein